MTDLVNIDPMSSGEIEVEMEKLSAQRNKLATADLETEIEKSNIRKDLIALDIKKNELKLRYNDLQRISRQAQHEIKVIDVNLRTLDKAAWRKRRGE